MLEALERENLFLIPLDNRRAWYRYHHLFAEFLRGRLAQQDPEERPVHVWHGLADPQAAPAWGEYLVARLPRALPHFVPGEGHFSILVNHQIDILQLAVSGLGQR